jgi:hypothetical protein
LEEIDGEAGAEDDPEDAEAMGGGEGGHGRGAAPHERFAGESVEPVGLCSGRGKARTQRREEARHGGQIARVGISLRLEQSSFLPKDEAIYKEQHGEKYDEETEAARQQADSDRKKKIPKIKRVADKTKRPVGDQLILVERRIENDGAAQVSNSPGAKESAQSDSERSEDENNGDAAVEGRRVLVRAPEKEAGESDGDVGVVHAVKLESQPEDGGDHPEAETEFEFRGSKMQGRLQGPDERATSNAV